MATHLCTILLLLAATSDTSHGEEKTTTGVISWKHSGYAIASLAHVNMHLDLDLTTTEIRLQTLYVAARAAQAAVASAPDDEYHAQFGQFALPLVETAAARTELELERLRGLQQLINATVDGAIVHESFGAPAHLRARRSNGGEAAAGAAAGVIGASGVRRMRPLRRAAAATRRTSAVMLNALRRIPMLAAARATAAAAATGARVAAGAATRAVAAATAKVAAVSILTGLGSAIGGLMSIWTAVELHNLKARVNKMAFQVKANQLAIDNNARRLDAAVAVLERLTDELEQTQRAATFLAAVAALQQGIEAASLDINIATAVIGAATNSRRLHPAAIKSSEGWTLLRTADRIARRHGFHVIASHPLHLHEAASSFIAHAGTVRIVAHLAAARHEDRLSVLRWLPSPWEQLDGIAFTPRPEKTIIAVSPDQRFYRTLTAEELLNCETAGETFLCRWQNTLHTNFTDDCLASMWKQNPVAIRQQCVITAAPAKNAVYQTARNTFLVYSRHAATATESCRQRDGKKRTRMFGLRLGPNTIHVRDDCVLYTEDAVVHPSTEIGGNGSIGLVLPWANVNASLARSTTTSELRKRMARLAAIERLPTDTAILRAWAATTDAPWPLWARITATSGALVGAAALAAAAYGCARHAAHAQTAKLNAQLEQLCKEYELSKELLTDARRRVTGLETAVAPMFLSPEEVHDAAAHITLRALTTSKT